MGVVQLCLHCAWQHKLPEGTNRLLPGAKADTALVQEHPLQTPAAVQCAAEHPMHTQQHAAMVASCHYGKAQEELTSVDITSNKC